MQLYAQGSIDIPANAQLDTSECSGGGSVLLSADQIYISGAVTAMSTPELCTVSITQWDRSSAPQVAQQTPI